MSETKIYVGCTGFNYEDWKAKLGGFYPAMVNDYELLKYYSTQFTSCEINSTFYAFPRLESTRRWTKQLPSEFILTAKIPKEICQASDISLVEEKLSAFLYIMKPLQQNLGPLVMQFAPSFEKTEKTWKQLQKFISFYPLDEYQLAIEFRHKTWFNQETYDLLNEHNLGTVSSILPYIKFDLYEEVKNNYFYLRLIGSHKQEIGLGKELISREETMEETASVLEKGFAKNVNKTTAFVYINNHFSGYAPPATTRFKEILEERKLNLIEPEQTAFKGQQKLSDFFG